MRRASQIVATRGRIGQEFIVWMAPPGTYGAKLSRHREGSAIPFWLLLLPRVSLLTPSLQVASESRESATGEIDRLDGELLGLSHHRCGVAKRIPVHLAHRFARVGRPLA